MRLLISSSSITARSVDYPAVKEVLPIPKKPKSPPSPRMTPAREKKVLRRVKKTKILKTAKGSIAKVRRNFPGTASLRDTSSEGSVSSGRVSIGSSGSRKTKTKLDGILEKANPEVSAANLCDASLEYLNDLLLLHLSQNLPFLR